MCGLADMAAIGRRELPAGHDAVLAAMVRAVSHRGPDAERLLVEGPVGLAFTRLALVGPQSGDQPLFSADGRVALIANGEVYNHRALEVRGGIRPRTASDCEVLAHLYAEHGEHFLDDVVGIYSIVLWDRRANRLVMARDRFGVKPLFYTEVDGCVLFGSEIKALMAHPSCLRRLDWSGALSDESMNIAPYLTDEPVRTWFEGIHTVPAGAVVTVDLDTGQSRRHDYWTLPSFAGGSDAPDRDFVAEYRQLLTAAVADSATADAELGLFLSGGIDSAAVAALAVQSSGKEIHTFTVLNGATAMNGDAEAAHRFAAWLRLPNHQLVFDAQAVPDIEEWKRLLWLLETPLCTAEQFMKFELHRYAKQVRPELRGMLLGSGGDEFNGGFTTTFSLDGGWGGFEAAVLQLAQGAALQHRPKLARWWEFPEGPLVTDEHLRGFAGAVPDDPYPAYVAWRNRQMQQYNCWHDDRTAAGNGVEARVPFLDHRIVELLARIPAHSRANLLWDKRILRDAVRDVLPDSMVRRPKGPFYFGAGVGYTQHVMVKMLAQAGDALLDEAVSGARARQFLRPDAMRATLRRLETEREPWDFEFLLRLVNLGLLDNMLDEVRPAPVERPSTRVLPVAEVEDWAQDTAVLTARMRHRDDPREDDVIALADTAMVLQVPDEPQQLFIAVNGVLEYVAAEADDPAWWGFLCAVDGKRTLAEILAVCEAGYGAVEQNLRQALEEGVLERAER